MRITLAAIFGTAMLGGIGLGAIGGAIYGLATYDGFFGSRATTALIYGIAFAIVGAGAGLVLWILFLLLHHLTGVTQKRPKKGRATY